MRCARSIISFTFGTMSCEGATRGVGPCAPSMLGHFVFLPIRSVMTGEVGSQVSGPPPHCLPQGAGLHALSSALRLEIGGRGKPRKTQAERSPRVQSEGSLLHRLPGSYRCRQANRLCAIYRVVGVTTARSTQGFQEALQSVYRIGFPKTDRPIFARTREKLKCLYSRRCFRDFWDESKESIRISDRVLDNNKHSNLLLGCIGLYHASGGMNGNWHRLCQVHSRWQDRRIMKLGGPNKRHFGLFPAPAPDQRKSGLVFLYSL